MSVKKSPYTSDSIGIALYSSAKIGPLIFRFATPAVLSLLVNSSYNIADQIFIGHGVGELGNAAVNLCFPIAVLVMAVAALIGEGAAAYFGLRLGEGHRDKAEYCLFTASVLSLAAGITLAVIIAPLVSPILRFSGTTEHLMPLAAEYLTITLLGFPAVVVSTVLSGLIRADGNPRYAMICVVTGCMINVVLDPVFIFSFGMGIAGAAWATVLGQTANLLLVLCYLPRFQIVQFHSCPLSLFFHTARNLLRLGLSGFVNQFSGAVYMLALNRALSHYGALSPYGAAAPLAAYGIVSKVSQVAFSVMNGISVGCQPILSYNYGEKNYNRVRSCLNLAVCIVSVFSCLFFLVFQLFPGYLISLFGQQSAETKEFAISCFRIFLAATPLFGFSILATGLFQAIGKPVQATIMALSRQILFLLPLIWVLPKFWGLDGLLWSAPISDLMAFITCFTLYLRENKKLKTLSIQSNTSTTV